MKSFLQYINELKSVSDMLNKQGDAFLTKILNKKVAVNLKIDQAAFVLETDSQGVVSYKGREGGKKIDLIKRLGVNIYEPIIKHLESVNTSKLPKNIEVFMEFFDAKLPTYVQYALKPRNNLIISYVKVNGKTVAPDDKVNKKVADILKVSPPPLLFSGKLSAKQKEKLKLFVSMDEEERLKKYGEAKFVKFVLSLFIIPKDVEYLAQDKFEGLVFYFSDSDQVMAKVVDPAFSKELQAKKKKNSDDKYLKAVNNVLWKNLDKNVAKALKSKPNGYIDFVVKVTILYMKQGKQLDSFDEETITKGRFARINFEMLPQKVTSLVKKKFWIEDIFRALLFMFQAEKKRANPAAGLTKERKEMVNKIIDDLNKQKIGNR